MPLATTTAAFKAPMLVRRSVVEDTAADDAAAAEALKSPKSNANALLLRSSSSATNLVHNNNNSSATANNAHGRASIAVPMSAPPVVSAAALARKSSVTEPFEVRLQRQITSESFWAPSVTSRSQARTQLATLGVGSFLVRPSSSDIANSFALSHNDRAHGVGHLLLCCHEEPNGSISYSICPDRNKEPTSPTVLGMLQNLGFPDGCRCGWELEGPPPTAAGSGAAFPTVGQIHSMIGSPMLSHAASSPMLSHQHMQHRASSAHLNTSAAAAAAAGRSSMHTPLHASGGPSTAQLAASIPSPKPHDNDSGGSIDAGEDLHPGPGVEWQPDADRPAAEEWLRVREPGSYLVRPSKGRPGCLTVSCKEKPSGKVVHASIFRGNDGRWQTEAKQSLRWATVRELLRALPYNLVVDDIYVAMAGVSDQGVVISPRTSTVSLPAAPAPTPAAAAVAASPPTAAALSPAMSRPGPAAGRNQFRMPSDAAGLRGGLNRAPTATKPPLTSAASAPVVQRSGGDKSQAAAESAAASAADDLESLFPSLPTDASVEALFPTVAAITPPATTASRQSANHRPLDKSPPRTTPPPAAAPALSQSGRGAAPRRESLGLPSSASSDKPPARAALQASSPPAPAAAVNKSPAKAEPPPETDNYGSAKLIGMRAKAGMVVSAGAVEARQLANGTKGGAYRSMPSMGATGTDLDAEFDAIEIENVEF
jgi:hypothetical protein